MDLRVKGLPALLAAALLLAPAAARAQVLSPGKLSQAHADLEGDDNCSRCHSSGKKVDDGKCTGCHDDIGARVKAGTGLHGRAYAGKACSTCHIEHNGRKTRLIRWPGGDRDRFDHGDTGWKLDGGHAAVACDRCHDRKNARGAPTLLGAPTACASCHQDPHDRRLGSTCTSCHVTSAWTKVELGGLDHDKTRFRLTGKHTEVTCARCHGEPPKYRGLSFGACSDCHEDPHKGKMKGTCQSCHDTRGWSEVRGFRKKHPGLSLAGGHARVACDDCHDKGSGEKPSKGSACVDCHPVVHEADFGRGCKSCHGSIRWTGLPRAVGLEAHPRTPFPLRGRHVDVECASCHPNKLPARERYRRLTFDKCGDCHADRHAGEFAARPDGDCRTCHTEAGFTPTLFDVRLHATTAFPLEGRHEAAPCGTCHTGKRPRVDFRVPKRDCLDCHQNPHGDQFQAEMAAGGCAHCHSAGGWDRPTIDHASWPLTGAHATTACAACHGRVGSSGDAGVYRGVPRACDGCHADAHAGQFRLNEPVRACDACHTTTSYAIPGFDHEKLAGYALTGEHAATACADCHPKEKLRNGSTAVRWRLGYRSCRACHANPHEDPPAAGQRETARSFIGEMDCAACHAPGGWNLTPTAGAGGGFDHAQTGFPLAGAHRTTDCTACHGGDPPTRECAGCHEDAHDRRLGSACAECHSSVAWDDTRTLERHRRTRLPLTGRHAVTDCNACHLRTDERQWTSVPADCFACHEDDYRRGDLHPDHDGDPADPTVQPYPRECSLCHRPTGWSPATVNPSVLSTSSAARAPAGHDARFAISFGKHRGAACDTCHPGEDMRIVACTGCHAHDEVTLAVAHRQLPVPARRTTGCLGCHPGGVAR